MSKQYKKEQYFNLFADCIPVRGASRSIICDIALQRYRFIPNELWDILQLTKTISIHKLKQHFNNEFDKEIEMYIELLVSDSWGHYTFEPQRFPAINLYWDFPGLIQNAIIDIDNYDISEKYVPQFVSQLDVVSCEALQVRIFCSLNIDAIAAIINLINGTSIRYIELIMEYSDFIGKNEFLSFYLGNPKIRSIIIYSSPKNEFHHYNNHEQGGIHYLSEKLNSELHCGLIDSSIFNLNITTFSENIKHNSCLNRKISMDKNGYIKNCPSMLSNFGHILDVQLENIVANENFNKYWTLSKDKISICKDCEFRYICTDCRAYLDSPEDLYSKPLKCGYNPYSCEWEDWSINSLKISAIKNYGIDRLLIN